MIVRDGIAGSIPGPSRSRYCRLSASMTTGADETTVSNVPLRRSIVMPANCVPIVVMPKSTICSAVCATVVASLSSLASRAKASSGVSDMVALTLGARLDDPSL